MQKKMATISLSANPLVNITDGSTKKYPSVIDHVSPMNSQHKNSVS
jgi:hypothetical protein